MGRPGWRLGGRRYHLVGATTGGWARRHPPQSSDHVSTASRGNAESRRESLDRATRRVRQDLVWLRKDPSNQAADDLLRVDRFSGRPSRLDLRKVRRLDREQSRSRKRSDARRHAQQHQSVLVDVDRDLLRAALRRKLLHGFLDPEAGLPCSRKRLPRRAVPAAEALGRKDLRSALLLERDFQGRSFRGVRATRHLRSRTASGVHKIPLIIAATPSLLFLLLRDSLLPLWAKCHRSPRPLARRLRRKSL